MAISQSLRNRAVVIEKYITLSATSGTNVGVSVPAGTLILAAGVQVLSAVPNVTTFTANITDGTTTFATDLDLDAAALNTIRVGTTAGFIATADTVDVVTTISGSPGAIPVRVFVLAVDMGPSVYKAAEVDRDFIR